MFNLFKSKKKSRGGNILIADDEPDYISTIEFRLKAHGYTISTVPNGQAALDSVAKKKPDLILLDINMPILNGHETLSRLKQNPETSDIPVIMVTANYSPDDITEASSQGIEDYIAKPFDFTELTEKIEKAITHAKACSA